jgi:hypothetical protein
MGSGVDQWLPRSGVARRSRHGEGWSSKSEEGAVRRGLTGSVPAGFTDLRYQNGRGSPSGAAAAPGRVPGREHS